MEWEEWQIPPTSLNFQTAPLVPQKCVSSLCTQACECITKHSSVFIPHALHHSNASEGLIKLYQMVMLAMNLMDAEGH